MKLETAEVEIHSRGLGDKHQYKVAQNAKIMNMLANSLYSDKVLAPVRELSTNALDGHVRGGNQDKPFDVYLPTTANPDFRIRDYGCGMNRQQLTEMYTTYGESDKSDSNDFNGCMGIGSKSPFAYSESFTTTSFFNGKKYVCVNAKDEDGIPTLQFLIDGDDTDEPNGIEVSFAVKHEDIYKFQEAAQSLYRYFPIMPNIARGTCRVEPREYVYQGQGWRIYKNSEDSMAIMGWIAYPIDVKHFTTFSDDSNSYNPRNRRGGSNDTPEAKLLSIGIELDFDIGEVEMDIARESLQYNKRTVQAIKGRIDVILDELRREVSNSFTECESLWDAMLKFQDLTAGKMSRLESLLKIKKPQFQGKDMLDEIDFKTLNKTHIVRFAGEGLRKPKRYDRVESFDIPTTAAFADMRFYENDIDRGAYASCERIILDESNKCTEIYLLKFDDAAAKDTFVNLMGWKDASILHMVSMAPKPDARERSQRENVFEFKLSAASTQRSSTRWAKGWWKPIEVEFEDGGVFVEINAFRCREASGREESSTNVGKMIKLLEELGVQPPEQLVGIKTSVVKKYRKADQWEDVFDWMRRQYDEYLKDNGVGEMIANIQEIEQFGNNANRYEPLFDDTKCTLDLSGSPIKSFWDKIAELNQLKDTNAVSVTNAQELASMLKYNLTGNAKYNLTAEEEKVLQRYEMLSVLDAWDVRQDDHALKVARYIQFVDSCEGEKV